MQSKTLACKSSFFAYLIQVAEFRDLARISEVWLIIILQQESSKYWAKRLIKPPVAAVDGRCSFV